MEASPPALAEWLTKLAAVYVPTTPNPASGYMEIVPLERIINTDWSVDEAMTFIISGGTISPGNINFENREKAAALRKRRAEMRRLEANEEKWVAACTSHTPALESAATAAPFRA